MKEILNKRIVIIFGCVIMSVFCFTLSEKNKENVIKTMAVPVTNKVIVVDAGHGGEDRWSS